MESGNAADWFSAAGTIFAAASALYIAQRKPKSDMMFVHHLTDNKKTTIIAGSNVGEISSQIIVINVIAIDDVPEEVPGDLYHKMEVRYQPNEANLSAILKLPNNLPCDKLKVQFLDEVVSKRYDCYLEKKNGVWVPYKIKKTNTLPEIKNKYPYNKFWARFRR